MTLPSLQQIKDEWDTDKEFSKSQVDQEIINISKIQTKYLTWLDSFKTIRRKYENELNKAELELLLYYTGRASAEIYKEKPLGYRIHKVSEVDKFVKADDKYIDISDKLQKIKNRIEFLNDIIGMIKDKKYLIRSYIDWAKFTDGGH